MNKSRTPPRILHHRSASGPRETEALKAAYDSGEREFDFKSRIYGAKSVKSQLIEDQYGKCCFCESKITHIDYGDVEHFRPKGAFRQRASDPLTSPGYYWLAYDWRNLFFCCALCNQRFKACLFPLRNPKKRARSHHARLGDEAPLLIDPADDDPAEHLEYVAEVVRAKRQSRKGQTTIEILGLNRSALQERRRDRLQSIRLLRRTVSMLCESRERQGSLTRGEFSLLEELEDALEECCLPEAEYSAMAKAALA